MAEEKEKPEFIDGVTSGPLIVRLTGGKEVELHELDAIDLLQATSYAGERPGAAVVNMTVNICSIGKIKKPDHEWVQVYPLRSKAEFISLGRSLSADDVVVLGATVSARALAMMSEEQKKDLATTLEQSSGASSPTD